VVPWCRGVFSLPGFYSSRYKTQKCDPAKMWSLNLSAAWRGAQGQCTPSPQACRHPSAPGRAARDPRRGPAPQAQAATVQTCVSGDAPAAKLSANDLGTWPKQIFRDRARSHPTRFTQRPFGIHARAPPEFPVSRAKLTHKATHASPLLPFIFSPACSPPPNRGGAEKRKKLRVVVWHGKQELSMASARGSRTGK
jgi:hypothetical protein